MSGERAELHNPDCAPPFEDFVQAMVRELAANAGKGDRMGWLAAGPAALLAEVHDHAAKLHVAARELIRVQQGQEQRPTPWGTSNDAERQVLWQLEDRVREFAADTANMAMMLADALGVVGREGPRV
jgi:hypothetical protein